MRKKVELSRTEKRERREIAEHVFVPGVYRERGYLLLTLSRHAGEIYYSVASQGAYRSERAPLFLERFNHCIDLNPIDLALSMLGRDSEGVVKLSARVKRRIYEMITKEELMKLSERAFAREYTRAMKLSHPVARISADPHIREKYVDQMLEAVAKAKQSEEEQAQPETSTGGAAASPEPEKPSAAKEEKPVKAAATAKASKAKKAPEKKTPPKSAAPAKKEARASNSTHAYPKVPASVKNPFREGSKKAKAFEVFRQGGARGDVIAKVLKLGVTEATAASWMNVFRRAAGA